MSEQRHYFSHKAGSILSNMAAAPIAIWGKTFDTAEHAYQWRKCDMMGFNSLARQVLTARNQPKRVKKLANKIDRNQRKLWRLSTEIHITLMYEVLQAKYKQSNEFRKEVEAKKAMYLLEDTLDKYWGMGCTHYLAVGTEVERMPGENVMGRLLMLLGRLEGENVDSPLAPRLNYRALDQLLEANSPLEISNSREPEQDTKN
jgi:ribA/ribD-fused uncharacterized protein